MTERRGKIRVRVREVPYLSLEWHRAVATGWGIVRYPPDGQRGASALLWRQVIPGQPLILVKNRG